MRKFLFSRRSKRFLLLALPCLVLVFRSTRDALAHARALRVYQIPSASMAPTLKPGDRICVDTLLDRTPQRGELWLFATPTGSIWIKRVIGLPGETVDVAGGQVRINGRPLSEPYLTGSMPYTMPRLQLKPGEYFLLGDSRATSSDSHVWGPVPVSQFLGRATYRCWPPARVGKLPNLSTNASVPTGAILQ